MMGKRSILGAVLVGLILSVGLGVTGARAQSGAQEALPLPADLAPARLYPLLEPFADETYQSLITNQRERIDGQETDFRRVADLTEDDPLYIIARSVGRIAIKLRRDFDGAEGVTWCTGTAISPRHVLTNRHCLTPRPGFSLAAAQIVLNYLEENSPEVQVFELAVDRPIEMNDREAFDYAIAEIAGDAEIPADFILSPDELYRIGTTMPDDDELVVVIGHPSAKPARYTRDCPAFDPAIVGHVLRHRCDTLGGSSGSLVLRSATGELVGLHYQGADVFEPDLNQHNSAVMLAAVKEESAVIQGIVQALEEEAYRQAQIGDIWSEEEAQQVASELRYFTQERLDGCVLMEPDALSFGPLERERIPAILAAIAGDASVSEMTYLVVGLGDLGGTAAYMQGLGFRRANAVKDYMVALGVSPANITTGSTGNQAFRIFRRLRCGAVIERGRDLSEIIGPIAPHLPGLGMADRLGLPGG